VNSARYSEVLRGKLKPAIWSEWRGLLSEGVALLHNNACPHTAVHTVDTLNPLHAKLNPICPLLALFRDHHILHISR